MRLFKLRLEKSEQSDQLETRLSILISDITKAFYVSICRGLFEKDKLLYSFLNTSSIQRRADQISAAEWSFFLRGSPTDFKDKENKASETSACLEMRLIPQAMASLVVQIPRIPAKNWHMCVHASTCV